MRTTSRVLTIIAAASLWACKSRPVEYGVSVFSTDTIPVEFTVTVTGSLGLGLRADGFQMRPDKSLVLATPAQMLVSSGDGTARIESIKGGRLAVQPLGLDSGADTNTVEGQVVMLTKPPEKRVVTLKTEKP